MKTKAKAKAKRNDRTNENKLELPTCKCKCALTSLPFACFRACAIWAGLLVCLLLCYTMRRPFDYLSIDAYQL